MTEHPILFSGGMVKAILDNRKTQTRRVVKWQYHESGLNLNFSGLSADKLCHALWGLYSRDGEMRWQERATAKCPYGDVGDRLWVRETYAVRDIYDDDKPAILSSSPECACLHYMADGIKQDFHGKTRPGIFMPRWASRITLGIVNLHVERLKDISHRDALAEGVEYDVSRHDGAPLARYQKLWDSINGKKHTWESNPWVWCVEFSK